MTDAKKERYRRIRGAILKLLAHEHPHAIDSKVLHFLLDDIGYTMPEEEMESHLAYLEEKKCLRVEKRKSTGLELRMIVISANGLDILDNFKQDCGVDVRF
ncbi:MAG: hypothetical protein WCY54_09060 [Syntrophales bacterium]|mgnify:CR=1 FL=1